MNEYTKSELSLAKRLAKVRAELNSLADKMQEAPYSESLTKRHSTTMMLYAQAVNGDVLVSLVERELSAAWDEYNSIMNIVNSSGSYSVFDELYRSTVQRRRASR